MLSGTLSAMVYTNEIPAVLTDTENTPYIMSKGYFNGEMDKRSCLF
jgi:hypothetical protein